jgi:hypothetical protein
MKLEEFSQSVSEDTAPDAILSQPLQALWWDAKGDWHQAHEVCQSAGSIDGDWVHAYLHRKEGDLGNASYWYRRARQPVFEGSLDDEWKALAETFLSAAG